VRPSDGILEAVMSHTTTLYLTDADMYYSTTHHHYHHYHHYHHHHGQVANVKVELNALRITHGNLPPIDCAVAMVPNLLAQCCASADTPAACAKAFAQVLLPALQWQLWKWL